ncbi:MULTISPECIES: GNAT family N-acetyltransferase [Roseateles]|uniref:GNAT family N-acetyltransferase n=1 Tax=Roseateles albus TaxID=2987525 RepID=A0ABT5K9E6_9BURK|nr:MULTISPECIES: GNAT family N-acetyltransferase [Roseateles]MCV2359881.1 GNAT family N-acetyltransferase [Paucibacter sp. TC2R-5]MDC8770395.1 GNAT family N-acetyltransferase [Roseateles albus]
MLTSANQSVFSTLAPSRRNFEAHAAAGQHAQTQAPTGIRKLSSHDLQWLPALADLLIDGVHRGASLGFLAPLSRYAAMEYWQGVFARLGPHHNLWIACAASESHVGEQLLGAVQLSLCPRLNAHHRGEVQGLMVHSRARGRGVASQLMARLECVAASQARTLLVLKAPSASQAEAVCVHLDWQRAGEIPDYNASADGNLQDATLYFKRLKALR